MNEIISKQPATIDEYITQQMQLVTQTMEERQIAYPEGFAVKNALMSAMLAIQNAKDTQGRAALQVVKKDSVTKALLEVVQNGLYLNKGHGFMIVFGDQLVLLTSYLGEAFKLKQNDKNVKDVFAQVVYEKDTLNFEIHHGYKVITKHEQSLDSIDNAKIKAAYCTVVYKDGTEISEIMTIDQIKKSWSFGQAKGESKAHKLAPDEMCKKTVIRRIAKLLNAINNDSLYSAGEEIEDEIDSKANVDFIDVGSDDADNGLALPDISDADTGMDMGEPVELDEMEQLELGDEVFDV